MTTSDNKILKTLELLTTLHLARQHFPANQIFEDQHILTVSKQLIADSGLTVMQFVSAMNKVSTKGYTRHFIVYDDHVRAQLDTEIKKSNQMEKDFEKLETLDTEEMSEKIKTETVNELNELAPSGKELPPDEFKDEVVKISELSKEGLDLYKKLRPDEIGIIFVLPFRSLNTLLEKMEEGMSFNDVEDVNIWYEPEKFRLHVGATIFTTAYRGTPSKVHFIFNALFHPTHKDLVLDFELVEYFNIEEKKKANKAYSDSMRHFTKNNFKLRDIFKVYSDRVEINPKYENDVH